MADSDANRGEGYATPEQVIGKLLKSMYPQNPDIVLGRESRRIVEALTEAGYEVARRV